MIAVMFGALVVTLLMGIPVGFSIGISVMLSLLADGSTPLVIMVQKMIDGVNSFTLMALPLFVLSGAIMAYGSTPRIMRMANLLLRRKQWGLGNAGIIGCAAFGTISGSGVATTAAIGGIIAPEMVKKGYGKGFTASILGASGTLGFIIPPSITFVVYAQVAGVSISDMFMAGIIPGILTTFLLCTLNKFMVKRNGWGTAVTEDEEDYDRLTPKERKKIIGDAVLPMMMPIIILGGVLSGIVTPTEAATIACVYALILSVFVYREMSFKDLCRVFVDSAVSASTVLIIMSAATPFGWMLTSKNVAAGISAWVLGVSGQIVIVYGIILLILLILGTFMETLATVLLTVPMFLPILVSMGVNPIAYGITMSLALAIGSVTPPLAVTLFTACKIIRIRVEETVPDVFYVCATMLAATVLTAVFPVLSTLLPSLAK